MGAKRRSLGKGLDALLSGSANRPGATAGETTGSAAPAEEPGLLGARELDYSRITAAECIVFDSSGPPSRVISAAPTYVGFQIDIQGGPPTPEWSQRRVYLPFASLRRSSSGCPRAVWTRRRPSTSALSRAVK